MDERIDMKPQKPTFECQWCYRAKNADEKEDESPWEEKG